MFTELCRQQEYVEAGVKRKYQLSYPRALPLTRYAYDRRRCHPLRRTTIVIGHEMNESGGL